MRTRLHRWLCGVVAGCVVLAAVPDVASAQASTTPNSRAPLEVKTLTLKGVTAVDPVDLAKSIETIASSCRSLLVTPICMITHSAVWFDRQYLKRDEMARDMIRIRVYYWLRGYRTTEVDTTVTRVDKDRVAVTFTITENAPTLVRRLSISFDSTLISQKRVQKLQLLKAGQPLSFVKLDSMRLMYADEMWAQGYGDAAVDTTVTIDTTGRVADVQLAVIPNRATVVGDIIVQGLGKVSEAVVLSSITLRRGDLYRQGDVLQSQRNLFETGLFRLATVQVPPQFDSVKKVTITVSESPLHDANVATGLTNIDFLQTEARYTGYNVFGGARRLELTATVANLFAKQLAGRGFFYDPGVDIQGADAGTYLQPTWSASADFRQPAFFRPENQVGFSAFAHRRSTPGIFIDRGYGGAVTFTDEVRLRAPVSLSYRFELNRVDAGDVYFCVNYGVCDTLAIQGLRSHQRLSPLLLTGFIDRSDDPLDPTRGYQARVDLEGASPATLSDYSYTRAFIDLAGYDHSSPSNSFGAHLRLGLVRGAGDGVVHPGKLFYAGGASSVRGYGTNQLGPRILTISSDQLTDTSKAGHCTIGTVADGSCNPNTVTGLNDSQFNPQPLGGTSLAEGSVEYRFAIGFQRNLSLAFFVDGALVGAGSLPTLGSVIDIRHATGAVTPGAGIRYKSAVGPIRIDVGFNPGRTETLPVATETVVGGVRKIVVLTTARTYTPMKTLFNRLTLHLSIGQAY